MDQTQAIQERFGAAAAAYAVSAVHRGGPDLEIFAAAAWFRRERVLDVGCGAGATVLAFARTRDLGGRLRPASKCSGRRAGERRARSVLSR